MAPSKNIIGVDESGKGDFFGPLVIASFLASDKDITKLQDLGVRDSKKISDNKILDIDELLCALFPHQLYILTPLKYNQRYEKIKNLNKLLAEGHAEVITKLAKSEKPDLAISDKFGKDHLIEDYLAEKKCSIPLRQLIRGEQIPQVAAASIIARAGFIRAIDSLSKEVDFKLPKGAGPLVDAAGRELIQRDGVKILTKTAKTHFKNFLKITTPQLSL